MTKILARVAFVIVLGMMIFGVTFSGLRAQSGHANVLTWTAPTSGGAPTTYNILRSTSSGTETQLASVPATQLTYSDAAGVGGTKYFYEVTATNSGGTGPVSNEVSATFLVSAPGAVGPLGVTAQ